MVAPLALQQGFMNSGQACIAGTQILVPASRLTEFEAAILTAPSAVRSRNPRDPATTIGPMVSQQQWDRVQTYIATVEAEGACLISEGTGLPDGQRQGRFVKPNIFTNVNNAMTIAREETFGTVLVIIPYGTDEEAIIIANECDYGLHAFVGGSTWSARQAELPGSWPIAS